MIERLPTPWGLVRLGVAPDHPNIKAVSRAFERIAQRPGYRFRRQRRGRTRRDPRRAARLVRRRGLRRRRRDRPHGSASPARTSPARGRRPSSSPGTTATPTTRVSSFDLDHERAVVIGAGNVALDVVRMLALTREELDPTDTTDAAIEAIASSTLRELVRARTPRARPGVVDVTGAAGARRARRRGRPRRSRTSSSSTRRARPSSPRPPTCWSETSSCSASTRRGSRAASRARSGCGSACRRSRSTATTVSRRSRSFATGSCPTVAAVSAPSHRARRRRSRAGSSSAASATAASRSRARRSTSRAARCRTTRAASSTRRVRRSRGLYCAGWIKRGPTGVIGTNKKDGTETAAHVLEDAAAGVIGGDSARPARSKVCSEERGVDVVTYTGWEAIDAAERAAGEPHGRPRVKLTRWQDLLGATRLPSVPRSRDTRAPTGCRQQADGSCRMSPVRRAADRGRRRGRVPAVQLRRLGAGGEARRGPSPQAA